MYVGNQPDWMSEIGFRLPATTGTESGRFNDSRDRGYSDACAAIIATKADINDLCV
jgi:hypothetical protein